MQGATSSKQRAPKQGKSLTANDDEDIFELLKRYVIRHLFVRPLSFVKCTGVHPIVLRLHLHTTDRHCLEWTTYLARTVY